MNTKTIKRMLTKATHFVVRNRAVILIGIGVSGLWGAVGESSRAAPIAKERIDDRKKELGVEKLTLAEKIKVAGPVYIPTILMTVLSTGCIIGGTSSSLRQNAALAAACSMSENALTDYKNAVVETVGEKKEKLIDETLSKKKIDKLPPADNVEITPGDVRCVDTFSGQVFYSNYGKIQSAISEINYDVATSDSYVSLNEVQQSIGMQSTEGGDILGWSVDDGKLEVYINTALAPDNTPCLSVSIKPYPKQNYWHN